MTVVTGRGTDLQIKARFAVKYRSKALKWAQRTNSRAYSRFAGLRSATRLPAAGAFLPSSASEAFTRVNPYLHP